MYEERMKFKNRTLATLLLSLIVSASAFALPEDQTKPIELEADQAKLNNKTGISEYIGNVIVIQGTAELRADRVGAVSVDAAAVERQYRPRIGCEQCRWGTQTQHQRDESFHLGPQMETTRMLKGNLCA